MRSVCNIILVIKLDKYFGSLFYIVCRGHHKLKLHNILSTYLIVEIYYFIAPLSDIRMFKSDISQCTKCTCMLVQ